MQYLLLLYGDESEWADLPDDEREAIVREYAALTSELQEKGVYLGGAPLKSTATATTMRVRNGEQIVTDGPFAETKEQLGGYFLVEAESVDEALEVAARIPIARRGSVEVRPLQPIGAEARAG